MKYHALCRLPLIAFSLTLTCSAQVLPPDVKKTLDEATITEDGMLNGPDNCRDTLMTYMKRNWSMVLDNFVSIAPKDTQKIILMRAAESLDAEDYLTFITRLRDMRLSNTISQNVFDWAFRPSHYKEGFLEFNYQQPAIRDFVRSVRPLVNPDMQKGLDDVLSGKSKKDLEEEWQADHTGKVEPNLILPTRGSAEAPPQSERPTALLDTTPMPADVATENRAKASNSTSVNSAEKPAIWPWAVAAAVLGMAVIVSWFFSRSK